jgi:hypothetical protein
MKRHVAVLLLVLPLGIIALGCEPPAKVAKTNAGPPPPPLPPGAVPPAPPVAPEAAPTPQPGGQAPLPVETKVGVFAGGLDDLAAPVSRPQPTPQPETERIKAQTGVGIKGRSLDQYEGIVVTPAKTLFTAKERIAFEIAVPHALSLFNASEGRNPESHEEFMENVITFNQIKLPELPPGHKYVYDPQTNELMVERPKLKVE